MKIIIAGATGLIGKALCDRLLRDGHRLTALVRRPDQARRLLPGTSVVQWDAFTAALGAEFLEGADAVVNLSGEPIASGHWKEAKKKRIRESRILGTRGLLETISRCEKAPKVLVNGSAIGFYGDRSEEILDEESMSGRGFLADVVVQWEAEAQKLKEQDIRVVLIRTGLVLSARGGALSRMLLPFRMFVGGPWEMVDSGCRGFTSKMKWKSFDKLFLMRESRDQVNLTAPQPVTNREFSTQLGRVLKRPSFLPAPAFALRLLLGEMAQALLLEGQRVVPRKLQSLGYTFQYPCLRPALEDLLK